MFSELVMHIIGKVAEIDEWTVYDKNNDYLGIHDESSDTEQELDDNFCNNL